MTNTDIALVNYFSKLIKRGVKTVDDAPENLRADITSRLKTIEVEVREGESE